MLAATLALAITSQAGPVASTQDLRLEDCMNTSASDPTSAISIANEWLEGSYGPDRAPAQQCLGFAYMNLLRWDAARDAFTAARDNSLAEDKIGRARLGAMAGNAALAAGANAWAEGLFRTAQADARTAGNAVLAGESATGLAHALVGLGRADEAAIALADARTDTPQDAEVWLLSATLSRRMGDLANASNWIEFAAVIDNNNPAIGLEAGLIAAMAGEDDAARTSWQSVIDAHGDTPEANAARDYLSQLNAFVESETADGSEESTGQ